MAIDDGLDLFVDEGLNRVRQVLVTKDLVALFVDGLALLVDDVVELDDALADVEVVALDSSLGALDGLGDEARLDRHVLFETEALHDAGDAVGGEALHEIVFEREVEARRARVALATGAATELVIYTARVVSFRTDDVQAAGGHYALVTFVADTLGLGEGGVVRRLVHLGRVEALAVENLGCETGRVAAELDVGAAAGYVRGDGHGSAAAGLGDDRGFLVVDFGVENFVLDAAPREHLGEQLGLLNRHGADQDGAPLLVHLDDLVDEGDELAVLVSEDEVRVVVSDHGLVGRNGDHFGIVDLVKPVSYTHGRTGHAGQLAVEAEVVLEGDRRHGDLLALNSQAFLRFDGLVETLAPAAAGHLATGELVDDDDLAVLDNVVAVPLEQSVGLEGRLEVAGQRGVGVVHVLDAEEPLHLGDAFLGRRHGLLFEVDEVVATLLRPFRSSDQARDEASEQEVLVGGFFGLATDD